MSLIYYLTESEQHAIPGEEDTQEFRSEILEEVEGDVTEKKTAGKYILSLPGF